MDKPYLAFEPFFSSGPAASRLFLVDTPRFGLDPISLRKLNHIDFGLAPSSYFSGGQPHFGLKPLTFSAR